MKVWEIRNAFIQLDKLSEEMLSEEMQGVDVSTFQQRIAEEWAKGEEALSEKLEGLACMLKNYQHKADAYEKEEREFARRKKALNNQIDFIKNRMVKEALIAAKVGKIECGVHRFSLRNSKSVLIKDENMIPEEYKETVTTVKIDKRIISKDLKDGEEIAGASLVENQSVQLK